MNIKAIEKINRNKDIADHIGEMVDEWLHDYIKCEDEITISDWNDLQEDIERYLNERDSE